MDKAENEVDDIRSHNQMLLRDLEALKQQNQLERTQYEQERAIKERETQAWFCAQQEVASMVFTKS